MISLLIYLVFIHQLWYLFLNQINVSINNTSYCSVFFCFFQCLFGSFAFFDFHGFTSSNVHFEGVSPGMLNLKALRNFRTLRLHDDDIAGPVGRDLC